ncbi:MAG: hypothetical protein QM820_25020 [Minicystis sp.]
MTAVLTILYEDARGQTKGFGLHTLVKACVFDAMNGDRHRVEAALADARPLKGVQNVLRACREDIDLIAADGRTVVAVIDNDAIRHHLRLPRTATDAEVDQAIKKGCRAPDRLHVILIKQNTESVLEAAAACDPTLEAKRVERAIAHKDLLERDAILTEISRERSRPTRDCVLGRMPSLGALVEVLCKMLRPKPPPAPPATATEPARKQAKGRKQK